MIALSHFSGTTWNRFSVRFIIVAIPVFLGIFVVSRSFLFEDLSFGLIPLFSIDSNIKVEPTTHNYLEVVKGRSTSMIFVLHNKEISPITVNGTILAGANRGEFELIAGGAPFKLAPGASQAIEVRFNPALPLGTKRAKLKIVGETPNEFQVVVPLAGISVDSHLRDSNVVHEEVQVGGSAGIYNVTTAANLTAVNGNLYLAAISTNPDIPVTSVSGLGLTWDLIKTQCSGRNKITRIEVWMAQGIARGDSSVMATFSSAPSNAVIVASRYSGADETTPVGQIVSGNTNGQDGACSGGTDSAFYSYNMNKVESRSVIYGAFSMRNTENSPGAGYFERADVAMGNGDQAASVATEDMLALTSTVRIDGRFSSMVDWAFVGLAINPKGGSNISASAVTTSSSGAKPIISSTGSRRNSDNAISGNLAIAVANDTYPTEGTTTNPTNVSTAGARSKTTGGLTGAKVSVDNSATDSRFTLDTPSDHSRVKFEEIQQGSTTGLVSVSTNTNLTAVAGNLYLAAVSTRAPVEIDSMTGLGLTWIPILNPMSEQCSGRNATSITVFIAQGLTTSDSPVTATFVNAPSTAVIAVSRYSGTNSTTPIGDIVSGNTNGLNGACTGGIDSAAYGFNLATAINSSIVYGAVTMRNKAHTPIASYTDQVELAHGNGGEIASIATGNMPVSSSSTQIEGKFSDAVDWAVVGLVINPSEKDNSKSLK